MNRPPALRSVVCPHPALRGLASSANVFDFAAFCTLLIGKYVKPLPLVLV